MTHPSLPKAFRQLAWSNLAAQSAEQIGLATAPLLAVLALGAGAAETGLLHTAQTLPFLLLAIPAGLLADRFSRRGLMAAAEALRFFSFVAILLLAALGGLDLMLLAVLGFIGAAGTVAYSVAAPTLVPALVPRDALTAANTRLELARTIAFTAGPALAGWLVGWVGALTAFATATALSAIAVFLLLRLRAPVHMALPKRHPMEDLREGGRFLFGHALLRPVFLTQLIFNAAFFVLQAVYAPYAVHRLGMSASEIGLTLALYGTGMVAGALLASRIASRVSFGTLVAVGPVCGLLAALAMLGTIILPHPALAALSFFLLGVGPILWVISTTTLRQVVTPQALLGRVSALTTLAYGTRPIGAAIGAAVGGVFGMEACLLVAAIGFAAQLGVILLSPVTRLLRLPDPAVA